MKNRIYHTLITLLLVGVLFFALSQSAMAASASLSGSSSIQPGNTVTLTLSVNEGSIYGLSGTLSYGSNLSFTNYNCSVSGWSMEVNGTNFSAYGTTASTGGAILTVTLKVASDAPAAGDLTASFGNLVVSDGEKDIPLDTASWSGKVSAPPSNNCDLSGIIVTNATLSPAFSKNTTYYTCTVPYSVEKLNMDYNRADGGQSVSISGNGGFVVGENTITLTVKAANGATKTYTIVVTRQQDPNYKPSTDATLSALELEGATLSPAFNPKVTEYIAYVSHETGEVKVSGVANDEKAMKVAGSEKSLMTDGVTDLTVVCTAEDGTTTQTYTIHVYRMPAYTGGIPRIEYINQEEDVPESENNTDAATLSLPAVVTLPLVGEVPLILVAGIVLLVVFVLLFVLGILIGRLRRGDEEYEEYEEDEEEQEKEQEAVYEEVIPKKEPAIVTEKPAAMPIYREPIEEEQPPVQMLAEEKKEEPANAEEMSLEDLLKDIHNM